jgi:phage-related protein
MIAESPIRPVIWLGATRETLRTFPKLARSRIGRSLYAAQVGRKLNYAKPLKGFGGASVLEVVGEFDGNAYRAAYTVRFASAVYVLHVFEKKSKKGISTPRHHIEIIRLRLKQAQREHEKWQEK